MPISVAVIAMTAAKTASEDKIWYLLAYLVPVLTGIIAYALYAEKDKKLRFHAVQSIFYGIAIWIFYFILSIFFFVFFFLFFFLSWIPGVILLLLWLYGLYIGYQAYSGKEAKMPVIGDMAAKA